MIHPSLFFFYFFALISCVVITLFGVLGVGKHTSVFYSLTNQNIISNLRKQLWLPCISLLLLKSVQSVVNVVRKSAFFKKGFVWTFNPILLALFKNKWSQSLYEIKVTHYDLKCSLKKWRNYFSPKNVIF